MSTSGVARRVPRCLIVLLLGSSPLASGCSVFFVHGPTEFAPGRYTPCTSNHLAPVVDSFIAAFQVGRTIIAIDREGDDNIAIPREVDIGIGAALTAAFIGSAIYGYTTVNRCLEIRRPVVAPRPRAPARPTAAERRADEAAEEAAVQTRLKQKAAAEAKAEADGAAPEQEKDAGAP